ncbi:MAG: MBL fold metallo-hydrolase [Lachnospiraceae bacterium]|nr:MBL fold metallo-hydrolase [Lachnospiraceae bacterium]
MKFCALASGSSGNCIYAEHEGTRILIDAGISCKRIEDSLASIGVNPAGIDTILITHDHSDHIQGAAVFSRKYGTKIYATAGTLNVIVSSARSRPDNSCLYAIEADSCYDIGTIGVETFKLSHDAADPVGFALVAGGRRIGIATDLGCYDESVLRHLRNADILYVEANHDVNMLMMGRYPYPLKIRVNSPMGHLSNEACAELVREVRCDHTEVVMLAHISKENNFEELAFETVKQSMLTDTRFCRMPRLMVANRDRPTEVIELEN